MSTSPHPNFRHGHALKGRRSGTYKSWRSMRKRCLTPSGSDYPAYGAKGISICSRWDRFQNFLADMGERPEGMSLERINNDGNYEPSNCKWATRREQARNRKHCRFLEYHGERKTLSEWAELRGMGAETLRFRLARGWPLEKALEAPIRAHTRKQKAA